MNRIRLLQNTVQEYAWGSHTAIAELTGAPTPSERPQAEMWMGAHPRGPSLVLEGQKKVPLTEVIRRDPDAVLGPRVVKDFGPSLPFLFKVLAAEKPLSIQAHPDADQARKGYARENEQGIDPMAPERNYRDPNHKPELICALTAFWAVNGFRPAEQMDERLARLDVAPGHLLRTALTRGSHGIRRLFETLMTMEDASRAPFIDQLVRRACTVADEDPAFSWMARLADRYAGDPGVLCPVLLNLVRLEPGQAMYLPARRLHAYLDGTGIEIMANSDNVLRGGLTPKHVDVDELLGVLSFEPTDPGVMQARRVDETTCTYATDAREFELSEITVDRGRTHRSGAHGGVQILLCTRGRALVRCIQKGIEEISIHQGQCMLVEASAPEHVIEGEATFYRARVPLRDP